MARPGLREGDRGLRGLQHVASGGEDQEQAGTDPGGRRLEGLAFGPVERVTPHRVDDRDAPSARPLPTRGVRGQWHRLA